MDWLKLRDFMFSIRVSTEQVPMSFSAMLKGIFVSIRAKLTQSQMLSFLHESGAALSSVQHDHVISVLNAFRLFHSVCFVSRVAYLYLVFLVHLG